MSQAANLQRVTDNIARHVIDFCRCRIVLRQRSFHACDPVAYVTGMVVTAPDSPSRVLRDLRRQGRVDYIVVSRRASLYRGRGGEAVNFLFLHPYNFDPHFATVRLVRTR